MQFSHLLVYTHVHGVLSERRVLQNMQGSNINLQIYLQNTQRKKKKNHTSKKWPFHLWDQGQFFWIFTLQTNAEHPWQDLYLRLSAPGVILQTISATILKTSYCKVWPISWAHEVAAVPSSQAKPKIRLEKKSLKLSRQNPTIHLEPAGFQFYEEARLSRSAPKTISFISFHESGDQNLPWVSRVTSGTVTELWAPTSYDRLIWSEVSPSFPFSNIPTYMTVPSRHTFLTM